MKYVVEYKKSNKVSSPELENIILRGEIGARYDRFVEERVSGRVAIEEILKEAEECIRDQYDDEVLYALWRGEFWGKLMISGACVARNKGDEALKRKLLDSAYRVLDCQREDGYLSSYASRENIVHADPELSMRISGTAQSMNWNVWCQKYTLWGLLECARLNDDKHILDCAEKMAVNLLDVLEESGLKMRDCGVMSGMAACSIMKPLLILYRLTGCERYLKAAEHMAKEWRRDDNQRPNLILNALSDAPPAKWYEGEERGWPWIAKAYEMMSCYEGICELYRINGDAQLLESLEHLYKTLKKYELNILGSVGYNERFADAAAYPDASTEICDVIHWMRICYDLFTLTGEAKYMESIENAFVNAFLAGVFEDGKWGAFFVRSSGRHLAGNLQVETKYQHCCVNNVARAFCNMAESVIMKSGQDYYVNSYIPSAASFGETDIKLGRGYLDEGSLNVTVRNLPANSRVFLRIPEWSTKTKVKCGEEVYSATAGEYFVLNMPEGNSVIRMMFDMTPGIMDFTGKYVDLPDSDYHIRRRCDGLNGPCGRSSMVPGPMSTVRRGALLYARSKRIGSAEEEMFSGKTVYGQGYQCKAEVRWHERMLNCCEFTFEKGQESFSYLMCDFASAANRELEDARYFTVFV